MKLRTYILWVLFQFVVGMNLFAMNETETTLTNDTTYMPLVPACTAAMGKISSICADGTKTTDVRLQEITQTLTTMRGHFFKKIDLFSDGERAQKFKEQIQQRFDLMIDSGGIEALFQGADDENVKQFYQEIDQWKVYVDSKQKDPLYRALCREINGWVRDLNRLKPNKPKAVVVSQPVAAGPAVSPEWVKSFVAQDTASPAIYRDTFVISGAKFPNLLAKCPFAATFLKYIDKILSNLADHEKTLVRANEIDYIALKGELARCYVLLLSMEKSVAHEASEFEHKQEKLTEKQARIEKLSGTLRELFAKIAMEPPLS